MPLFNFLHRGPIQGAMLCCALSIVWLPRCAAQEDPAFHSCTAAIGGGYDWVRGSDGKDIDGRADFQGGGGFAVTREFFITANFMYDSAHILGSALPAGEAGKVRYYTATVDPTYRFRTKWRVSPYILGGFGWLLRSSKFTEATTTSPILYPGNAGIRPYGNANSGVFDVGGGLNIKLSKSGAMLYVEARYFQGLAVNSHTGLVPLALGFRW